MKIATTTVSKCVADDASAVVRVWHGVAIERRGVTGAFDITIKLYFNSAHARHVTRAVHILFAL